jgi:hypothetical protein
MQTRELENILVLERFFAESAKLALAANKMSAIAAMFATMGLFLMVSA